MAEGTCELNRDLFLVLTVQMSEQYSSCASLTNFIRQLTFQVHKSCFTAERAARPAD